MWSSISKTRGRFDRRGTALITRIEEVAPPDEIYLTLAARLALVSAEIRTSFVKDFTMQGFVEPIPVYCIETRHRTHVLTDAYILLVDLRGFTQLTQTASVGTVERVLDTLDTLANNVAREFEGTIRFGIGDAYFLTFPQASHLIAAADRLSQDWNAVGHEAGCGCSIHIVLHRGSINAFRSFLYGDGIMVAGRALTASKWALAVGEGGTFITNSVYDELSANSLHNRLRPVALEQQLAHTPGLEIYRLDGA
jgi:class 3 adenylate cyclase